MNERIQNMKAQLTQGSRLALAKAITLVESTRSDHRRDAEALLAALLPLTGTSIRIAISGPPGVGKSSFIEAFGLHLTKSGKKLAVLAIDPSSPVTGGSILGDKTRMEELSKSENCFIRPSPSSGSLGGVARHTRETLLLCEAAGFDVVLIETVGIGQSEVMAASMTDIFVQLHQPHSGDELQGVKKGVMELADLIVITKADGESLSAAALAKSDLERAVSLTRSEQDSRPEVILTSAHKNIGVAETWSAIKNLCEARTVRGDFQTKRQDQIKEWLHQEITSELFDMLSNHPKYENLLNETLHRVESSGEHCGRAARQLVASLLTTVE